MKKSELTQLTQIIEVLVTREIRKQLPKLVGEVFQNMTEKSMVMEHAHPACKDYVGKNVESPTVPKNSHEFKASLKELFAGVTPITKTELEEDILPQSPRAIKHFTKDPILNQILNETTGDLRQRERMTGLAAFQGGYNPTVSSPTTIVGAGEMMTEAEMPSFARGMPAGGVSPQEQSPSPIQEGHMPLAAIPEGVSALDVARAGITPPAVTEALTNYDRMKKILDASRGRR